MLFYYKAQSFNIFDTNQLKSEYRQCFSDICQTVKQALQNVGQKSELEDFAAEKDFDLTQALKGFISSEDSNKLCDMKLIIGKIQIAFTSLKCDQCGEHAKIAWRSDQETLYKLSCKLHFEENNSYSEPHIDLCDRLRLSKIVLNDLDAQLAQVQDKVDCFNTECEGKDQVECERINECIQQKLEDLKNALAIMTANALKTDEEHGQNTEDSQDDKTAGLEYLLSIKDNCDKCRDIILNILSIIPETLDRIDSYKDTHFINDSGKEILFCEEAQINLITCAIDDKYGKDSQKVYIPPQSLVSVKEIEKKIKSRSEYAKTCAKVPNFMMNFEHNFNITQPIILQNCI